MKLWIVLLIIFVILVSLDKGLTYINIKQAQKNFPNAQEVKDFALEKNPLARFFFKRFGLEGGTLIYWALTILSLFIAFFLLKLILKVSIVIWIICIIYGFVIANNFFFFFKFSGMVP